jgi:hypothetical protein
MTGDDLADLREQHPGWHIEATWTAAATGPDIRTIRATSGGVTLTAHTAAALAAQLEHAERAERAERAAPRRC